MTERLELVLHNRQQAWAAIRAQVFPFLGSVLQAGGRWVLTIKRMTRTGQQNRRCSRVEAYAATELGVVFYDLPNE